MLAAVHPFKCHLNTICSSNSFNRLITIHIVHLGKIFAHLPLLPMFTG